LSTHSTATTRTGTTTPSTITDKFGTDPYLYRLSLFVMGSAIQYDRRSGGSGIGMGMGMGMGNCHNRPEHNRESSPSKSPLCADFVIYNSRLSSKLW